MLTPITHEEIDTLWASLPSEDTYTTETFVNFYGVALSAYISAMDSTRAIRDSPTTWKLEKSKAKAVGDTLTDQWRVLLRMCLETTPVPVCPRKTWYGFAFDKKHNEGDACSYPVVTGSECVRDYENLVRLARRSIAEDIPQEERILHVHAPGFKTAYFTFLAQTLQAFGGCIKIVSDHPYALVALVSLVSDDWNFFKRAWQEFVGSVSLTVVEAVGSSAPVMAIEAKIDAKTEEYLAHAEERATVLAKTIIEEEKDKAKKEAKSFVLKIAAGVLAVAAVGGGIYYWRSNVNRRRQRSSRSYQPEELVVNSPLRRR